MTACPICGNPVDSLRAPAVKVRAGKVVAFCSAECAQLGETQPTAVPATSAAGASAAAPAPARTPAAVRTPATGVVITSTMLDSGPVIEVIHEPVSGVVTSAPDARVPAPPVLPDVEIKETKPPRATPSSDTLDKWTMTDEQLDAHASRASGELTPVRARSRLPLTLLVLVLVGAGGYFAYRYLVVERRGASDDRPASAALDAAGARAVASDAPAPPTPEPVARARAILTKYLTSDSPRVQRVAAAALSRTGDPDAIAVLGTALAHETSDVAKLEIAYALARAGDPHGAEALAAAASAGRSRDLRAGAARLLVELHDQRGVPPLVNFLDVSQLRLGAAEQLAYVADPRALKVLDAIRADDKTSPDDRARATIALGLAGRADAASALQALLTDARFNAFAAVALAQLHDPSARPVLLKHLEIPSLRVGAARALRVLEPALDPTPMLPALLAALDSAKDTEQVQVAEAILLLAGPVEWSAHP